MFRNAHAETTRPPRRRWTRCATVRRGLLEPLESRLLLSVVSGTVRWTDSAGGTHPVPGATVEIREQDLFSSDLIATVTTGNDGSYNATFFYDDGFLQGDPDVFIRVLARSTYADVRSDGASPATQFMDSPITDEVAPAQSITIDRTAGRVNDNETAFSVLHAVNVIGAYAGTLTGGALPRADVRYPTAQGGTFYTPGTSRLDVIRQDRWDWDVIDHEYGHYVQDQRKTIDNSPGGNHSSMDNLAVSRGSKDVGIRLAWSEGWATFFSVTGQVRSNAAALGIPNVGDHSYSDTEDAAISYNIDTASGGGRTLKGEDNEFTIACALWDLQVDLGDKTLFDTIRGAGATTMAAAWEAIGATKDTPGKAHIGGILADDKIAPGLTAPADNLKVGVSATPPTFTWDRNGGGVPNPLNDFRIRFYDNGYKKIVFEKALGDVATYTPTAADWSTILKGDTLIHWIIEGKNKSNPVTPSGTLGYYWSAARTISALKVDLVFAIDNTGSMWDDIDAVKAAASTIASDILTQADARVALVSYRDFPVEPYGDPGDWTFRDLVPFTTDPAAIVAGINSMWAGGGYDWEESVYSALMHSVDATSLGGWRGDPIKKIVIVMGDAPPHDPEPFTGYTLNDVLVAAENADPVNFFTVMVGYDDTAASFFSALSAGSGGQSFYAASANEVVSAIREAIEYVSLSPFADAGGPYVGEMGQPVTFDAGTSYDPDGNIATYEWDWNSDGVYDTVSTTPTVQHAWFAEFSGTVRLRVTDNNGLTSTDTANVVVHLPSVDDLVRTAVTRSAYDRRTASLGAYISVTNTSTIALLGPPLQLVISDVVPSSITITNATGMTIDGKPYLNLLTTGWLLPGKTITKLVWFKNPLNLRFTFNSSVRGMVALPGSGLAITAGSGDLVMKETSAALPARFASVAPIAPQPRALGNNLFRAPEAGVLA